MAKIQYKGDQWRLVEKKLAERLEELRDQLETPTIGHDETLIIRGRIAEIRQILDWPTDYGL